MSSPLLTTPQTTQNCFNGVLQNKNYQSFDKQLVQNNVTEGHIENNAIEDHLENNAKEGHIEQIP